MAFYPPGELAKITKLFLARHPGICRTCRRENENSGTANSLPLPPVIHFVPAESFVCSLAVERHHARSGFQESALQARDSLAVISRGQISCRRSPTLHHVSQSNAELEHALIFFGRQPFRHEPRFEEQVPKLVLRISVVMSHVRRKLAWVEAHEDHFETRPEVIGQLLVHGLFRSEEHTSELQARPH